MDDGTQRGAAILDRLAEQATQSGRIDPAKPSRHGDTRLDGQDWPAPQPLTTKVPPEPYPLDALPDSIRAAVEEVAGFVKAPLPMVAASALAALSLASQAHIDAKRAEKLQSPVGLFLLTIADSGERKSTCDGFFTRSIRDYEDAQVEAAKPAIKSHEADRDAWTAERDGLLSAIKDAGKKGKSVDSLRSQLAALQDDKPEPPRVPKLLLGDETPENLAWGLAKHWPSAGVVSAEAGIIFGAHGMGKDSVMRNLGLLNVLWDGGSHSVGRRTSESFTVGRRTSESFTVRGARLTVALQIQEATLRSFFDRSGALARGTGFLARFLVAWPVSTQGHRPFTEAPENWPHLAAFHQRIAAILANPVPIDDDGALTPALMMLEPEAKATWVAFHDAIERDLVSGGELHDVRDVASKSADNAVRLAALFQLFEHGMGGAIGLECFESASRIAAWHLNEARRFFGELALPVEIADAVRLDTWLIEYCKRERTHLVGKNHARQHGTLRDGARLDAAIRELVELDRVRLAKDGKRITIRVNPALLETRT
jgi:putative DNA primase/helicase